MWPVFWPTSLDVRALALRLSVFSVMCACFVLSATKHLFLIVIETIQNRSVPGVIRLLISATTSTISIAAPTEERLMGWGSRRWSSGSAVVPAPAKISS